MFLPRCPGIFGMSLVVQTALIADTDTFTVEATGVRTDAFERTGRFDVPILANIKMIPHTVETTTRDIPKIPVPNGRNIRSGY